MRGKVRRQVHGEVRAQNLMVGQHSLGIGPRGQATDSAAARSLLGTYASLSRRGEHLFGDLLGGAAPSQWSHYPEDDAIDSASGFQWFYHSHAPDDRATDSEHGHIHLFARRGLWSRRLGSARERGFQTLTRDATGFHNTRHLLAIGFDAKGVPGSMFTVNSWVTGDRMLSAGLTVDLLAGLSLDTGHPHVDAVIQSLVALHRAEIRELLDKRDETLQAWDCSDVLSDQNLEVLSEFRIDVDAKLQSAA